LPQSNESSLDQISALIADVKGNLCKEINLEDFRASNEIAHKWKVTYRTKVLRELVSWRFCDLMEQIMILEETDHFLSSRILIRSLIETLAMMIYSNQKMENIISTGNGFHEYSRKTEKLLLGSKNNFTSHKAVGVLDVLNKCNAQYPELIKAYDVLSETVHPNWHTLLGTYAKIDKEESIIYFYNRGAEIFENSQISLILLLLLIFKKEYDTRWVKNFREFEKWVETNDNKLEDTKPND